MEKLKPLKEKEKKIAILDFDGTLSRGYISMDFLNYIYEKGAFLEGEYKNQIKMFREIKKGKLNYEKWCNEWGVSWARGMKNQEEEVIKSYAKEFFYNFKKNIYLASYELTSLLIKKNYSLNCLSIGASEVINIAAEELKIKDSLSTKLEIIKGIYTGSLLTNIHIPGNKEKVLQKIIASKGINLEKSIGFGDSESDICFLEMVENPILLNPKEKIKDYGQKRGWKIINTSELKKGEIGSILEYLFR